jgi:hypothetical protein
MADIAGQMGGLLVGHGRQVFAALFCIGSLGLNHDMEDKLEAAVQLLVMPERATRSCMYLD